MRHNSTDSTFNIFCRDNAGNEGAINTSESYRDLTAWYHVLVDFDSANAIANDRISLYVNGVRVGAYSGTSIGQNNHLNTNVSGQTAHIGQDSSTTPNYHMQGYLAQTVFLDNKSIANGDLAITDFLDTFTFGTNGSQRIPKSNTDIIALASAAGNNSFCLDYSDSSNIVNDASSKGNNFTPTGGGSPTITSANQSSNTPSLSYPLLNPLSAAFSTTLTEGNTRATGSTTNGSDLNPGIIIPKTGKWVWQITNNTDADLIYGVRNFSDMKISYDYTNLYGFYSHTGDLVQGASPSGSYLDPASGGDVYQIYFDADTRKMWVSDNGTIPNSGDPDGGTNEAFTIPDSGFDLCPTALVGGTAPDTTFDFGMDGVSLHSNGQTFKPLTSANLPTPDYQGIDYFDATRYEGNGTGQRVGDFVPFTDAYTVTNSVMLDDGDSRSLTLNSSATRTSATVAAFSLWTKRGNLGINARPLTVQVDSSNYFGIYYNTSDQLDFTINNGGATILQRITTRVFRDNSAWHNIVVIINQGEGTQADRVKVFYDGVQIPNDSTGFGTNTCTLDGSSALNFLDSASAVHDVGGGSSSGFSQPYDGYIAEVAFLDGADSGAKLNASDFGQVDTSTNRWVPKDIGGYDFGNTGYYLEFKVAPGTNDGAGTDTSGKSNNFTSNGSWATTDQFVDCPSQNFATFDSGYAGGGSNVYTEGLTKVKGTDGTNSDSAVTTFGMTGKVVFDFKFNTVGAGYPKGGFITGQAGLEDINSSSGSIEIGTFNTAGSFAFNSNGNFYVPTGPDSTTYNSTIATGQSIDADDVIRYEVDTVAGTVRVYFQNEGTGSFTELTAARVDNFNFDPNFGIRPAVSNYNNSEITLLTGGQTTLSSVSTGFLEINQDNLDDTASKLTAWSWIKNRDVDGDEHILVDRVRGVGEVMHSSDASSENTEPNTVQRFLQRGVQVGNDVQVNTAGESNVLWQWLLGDSATTGTVIPADNPPSLASTVIAADAGHFSVGTYSGASGVQTVGHGLGAAPDMLIVKGRNVADSWRVFHTDLGNGRILSLNLSNVGASSSIYWNNDGPTSTTFTVATDASVNGAGNNYVFLAFKSIPGVCKVGLYEGNGASDGTYISMGFKPRWVMVKVVDSGTGSDGNWTIYDTARQPFNSTSSSPSLFADRSIKERSNSHKIDILSDGVKFRDNSFQTNHTLTYIYLAMAEIGGNGTLPPIYGR